MFDELIGARLLYMDDAGFGVKLSDGTVRTFIFNDDPGDCCGYNNISARLLISHADLTNAPAITRVETINTSESEEDALKITFFGLEKKLAEINSLSSSGSGWCYGATASVICNETKEETVMTSY